MGNFVRNTIKHQIKKLMIKMDEKAVKEEIVLENVKYDLW